MNVEPFDVDGDRAYALVGPLSVVVWRTEAVSEDDLRVGAAAGRVALERSPGGVGLLAFAGGAMPSRPVRELSTAINARLHAEGAVGVAAILAQPGVIGAVQRGMAKGMMLLSPEPYPLGIFGESVAACTWLGERLRARRVAFDAGEAARKLDAFRRVYLRSGGVS